MVRSSKALKAKSVDLTSFLDILSTLFAVQVLLICILSLSKGMPKASSTDKGVASPGSTRPNFTILDSNNAITSAKATLLHCKDNVVEQYDGVTKEKVGRHLLSNRPQFTPARVIDYDYAYILVEPGCFRHIEKLKEDISRWGFLSIGIEPIPKDHKISWLK